MISIEPFRVQVPGEVLEDLKARLARTRWPDEVAGSGWETGTEASFLRRLVRHWQDSFDWRAQERKMNAWPQFVTTIDGAPVHFVHVRGRGPKPLPLLLTHGWPSSFLEMLPLVPALTDPASHGGRPEDSFDVVIPSLPGFGFSAAPSDPDWTRRDAAHVWARLMTEGLGYERFAAHGTDVGVDVTTQLGLLYADRLVGLHLLGVGTPYLGEGAAPLTAAERRFRDTQEAWYAREGAYAHLQATLPQTVAYALQDSPAGLASWIVEKYERWDDPARVPENSFPMDELLTIVTLYWVTGTMPSSMRWYQTARRGVREPGDRVRVPTGFSLTVEDVERAPREYAERLYHVIYWRELEAGGHFLALEQPEALGEEIRDFFRPLRDRPMGVAATS
jgi:pimeloyl-ACP methyl ester carboxylesterase